MHHSLFYTAGLHPPILLFSPFRALVVKNLSIKLVFCVMSLLRSLTILYTFIFYNNVIPSGFFLDLIIPPFQGFGSFSLFRWALPIADISRPFRAFGSFYLFRWALPIADISRPFRAFGSFYLFRWALPITNISRPFRANNQLQTDKPKTGNCKRSTEN